MPPLDLTDVTDLQASLDLLDEQDLIAELTPAALVRLPVDVALQRSSEVPRPAEARIRWTGTTTDPAPGLPPVPAPTPTAHAGPVRRRGPLPAVAPTRLRACTGPPSEPQRSTAPRHAAPAPDMAAFVADGVAGRGLLSWLAPQAGC